MERIIKKKKLFLALTFTYSLIFNLLLQKNKY
jgi:hypothetical protein